MAYPSRKPHILFCSTGLASGILKLIMAESRSFFIWSSFSFSGHIPSWNRTFCFSNGLTIWYSFSDITPTKVDKGSKSAFFNSIEWEFFRAYPHLKPHILFYRPSNGLAMRHSVSDNMPIKVDNGRHFEFDRVEICQGISLPEAAHFVLR